MGGGGGGGALIHYTRNVEKENGRERVAQGSILKSQGLKYSI